MSPIRPPQKQGDWRLALNFEIRINKIIPSRIQKWFGKRESFQRRMLCRIFLKNIIPYFLPFSGNIRSVKTENSEKVGFATSSRAG